MDSGFQDRLSHYFSQFSVTKDTALYHITENTWKIRNSFRTLRLQAGARALCRKYRWTRCQYLGSGPHSHSLKSKTGVSLLILLRFNFFSFFVVRFQLNSKFLQYHLYKHLRSSKLFNIWRFSLL